MLKELELLSDALYRRGIAPPMPEIRLPTFEAGSLFVAMLRIEIGLGEMIRKQTETNGRCELLGFKFSWPT